MKKFYQLLVQFGCLKSVSRTENGSISLMLVKTIGNFEVFTIITGMLIPSFQIMGTGKISLFVIQGTIIFPHSRLSSRSKKKIPHSRLRRSWENFFSLLLLSLSWGNVIVPFMTHREFLFPYSRLRRS